MCRMIARRKQQEMEVNLRLVETHLKVLCSFVAQTAYPSKGAKNIKGLINAAQKISLLGEKKEVKKKFANDNVGSFEKLNKLISTNRG